MGIETTKTTRSRTQAIAKKLLNLLRVVLIMVRKGISESKVALELHLLLQRGNKIAGKAIENLLMLNHHTGSSFSCKSSNDVAILPSFKEYEFSCRNTPNYPLFHFRKRNKLFHNYQASHRRSRDNYLDEAATAAAVQRVLEMLNNESTAGPVVGSTGADVAAPSPLILPGFGKSPAGGRQLRITDSPFPLKEEEESNEESAKVNKAADEFIKKFYKNLKRQTWMSPVDQSP